MPDHDKATRGAGSPLPDPALMKEGAIHTHSPEQRYVLRDGQWWRLAPDSSSAFEKSRQMSMTEVVLGRAVRSSLTPEEQTCLRFLNALMDAITDGRTEDVVRLAVGFRRAAAAEEREACAKLADAEAVDPMWLGDPKLGFDR